MSELIHLGIVGGICSGKGTVCEKLRGFGYRHISLSNLLIRECSKKGINFEQTRHGLQEGIKLLRERTSENIAGLLAMKEILLEDSEVVIDGIRNWTDMVTLRNTFGDKIIFIGLVAPYGHLYIRSKGRNRSLDSSDRTLPKIILQDLGILEGPYETNFQLEACDMKLWNFGRSSEQTCEDIIDSIRRRKKSSKKYLSAISNGVSGKSELIRQVLTYPRIPRIEGKVILLEIGTGGGETLESLKRLEQSSNVTLLGCELDPEIAQQAQEKSGCCVKVGNICNLPVPDKSVTIVHASSIFHEVWSYENGIEGLKKGIEEIFRVLTNGGYFIYRDPLCPENNDIIELKYHGKSWYEFMKIFIKYNNKENDIKITQKDSGGIFLETNIRFHREIQRHYLMFMHHVKYNFLPTVGIQIIGEERVGPDKKIHYIENGEVKVVGDEIFDDMVDDIIGLRIRDEGLRWHCLREWMAREGKESYIYLSSSEIGTIAKGYGFNIIEERSESRDYYDKYLHRKIPGSPKEGKQIIIFKKHLG